MCVTFFLFMNRRKNRNKKLWIPRPENALYLLFRRSSEHIHSFDISFMSDNFPTDTNASNSLSPEEVATLRALANSHITQPITSPIPTTIDAPRTQLLVISDEAQELIPAITGQHFFFAPADPEEDPISPDDLHFPKNPQQQYTAPGWDLPFPVDRSSPYYHFEQGLVKLIERQAHSTRPLDDFAIDFLANVTDPTARAAVSDFVQIMRSQLVYNARDIQELRTNNYLRAKGLQPIPEKKKGVNTSQKAIKASIKAAEEYAKALPKKQPNGGSGRGGKGGRGGHRGWRGNNFQYGQQQRFQYQQQYQQQPQYQQYSQAYPSAPSYQQQPYAFPPQGFNELGGYGQYPSQGFPKSNRGRGRGRGQSSQ